MKELCLRSAIVVGLFLFASMSKLCAQTKCGECEKIRRNPNYYWAESSGQYESYAEARDAAVAILTGNIAQHVTTEFDDKVKLVEVSNKSEVSSTTVSTMKSYTNVIIEDLNVIELSPEPEARVFCYVEKEKVKDIFKERKYQVIEFINSGKNAEKKLMIDDALRFYYWALLLASTLPDNVTVTFGEMTGNAILLLPQKIRNVLGSLDCTLVSEDTNEYGEKILDLSFKYNGQPVSSVRYKYSNGQSFAGPVYAKDGRGEAVLFEAPPDNKMRISYEYRFQDEAKQILPYVFENTKTISITEAQRDYPLQLGKKSRNPIAKKTRIYPETEMPVDTVSRTHVTENADYRDAILAVEQSIKEQNCNLAKGYMTTDCYKLFRQLIEKTGKVSLSKHQQYEYIDADGQVLVRYMYITLKVKGGKVFMDKLVFRFSPQDHKIHSFAFGLTEKAENDIFASANKWSMISRYTILGFMEDYQTAYALKQIDYIERIFSDNAIIVVGRELRPINMGKVDSKTVQLESNRKIEYNKKTKQEYIEHLKRLFSANAYVHLSFEDNTTRIINTGGVLPEGSAFGIQIKQIYSSSLYSDRGYLTLMLNMNGEHPMIQVRYWQPDKEPMVNMGKFFSKENFEW